jgi:hypothetical protein
MKKTILTSLFVFFVFLSSELFAEPVSVDQARKAAATMVKAETKRMSKTAIKLAQGVEKQTTEKQYFLTDTKEIRGNNGELLAYVTELEPEGFIITSADDTISPVLGYSFKGKFPFKDSKQNVLLHLVQWDVQARNKVMKSKSNEITTLAQTNNDLWNKYSSSETALLETLFDTTQWGPLVTTHWDQGYPFNKYCPRDPRNNYRCPVGCVATAATQIINYWNYPGTISFDDSGDSYTSRVIDLSLSLPLVEIVSIRIDEDAGTYDFPTFDQLNSALSTVNYGSNEDEQAYLCFAVGIKHGMGYSWKGSGSYLKASVYTKGLDYGSAHWKLSNWNMIVMSKAIENIKKGWPIQIGISNYLVLDAHSVVVDGYKETGEFHLNLGWGGEGDSWYFLPIVDTTEAPDPGDYYFNTVTQVVYDICPYQGWQQYGGNQYNNFLTRYTIPDEEPIREKWFGTISPTCKGMIVGTQNNIYITKDPLIINDPAYHPALVIINCYGEKLDEIEITQTSSTVSHPVESPDGNIYVGAGDGIYRIIPRTRAVQRIYYDAGNSYYGDQTPRLDESGRMYFGSTTTLICVSSTGSVLWTWNCPSGGVMYTGIPSVDTGRDNVYMGYWKSATQTAYLACINRLTGITRYEQSFSSITTADRGIHTPAIGSDGTVYTSVRTKIYALTPGTSSFSQKWMQDKLYARYQPIALGPDDTVYTEYWTQTGGSYYVTFAALNPVNGNVKWEVKKPDVGTYTNFGQPYCGTNGVVIFPVKWDTSPDDTIELFAYRDNGSSAQILWNYDREDDSAAQLAMGPGATVYLYGNQEIVALSNGDVGDPDGGGMSYTNNIRPNLPSTPTPADEANDIDLTVTLSWTCSDPEAQTLKYSLFVGESGYDMVPVATDLNTPSYNLNGLKPGTGYAWTIIATDGQAVAEGPTWVFSTKPPNPDLSGDGFVNFVDFAILASHWLESDCGNCGGADLDNEEDVDFADLDILAENWLAGTE